MCLMKEWKRIPVCRHATWEIACQYLGAAHRRLHRTALHERELNLNLSLNCMSEHYDVTFSSKCTDFVQYYRAKKPCENVLMTFLLEKNWRYKRRRAVLVETGWMGWNYKPLQVIHSDMHQENCTSMLLWCCISFLSDFVSDTLRCQVRLSRVN